MGHDVEVGDDHARKRIVVAVDESEESMLALAWCLDNYCNINTHHQVTLLHVKRRALTLPGKTKEDTVEMYSHDVLSSLEWRDTEMARWVIHKAKKLCQDRGVEDVDARIEEGDPRDVICHMVHILNPVLLVMGSHGYSPTAKALVGSVSTDCVQKVTCTVLLVKKPKQNSPGGCTFHMSIH